MLQNKRLLKLTGIRNRTVGFTNMFAKIQIDALEL